MVYDGLQNVMICAMYSCRKVAGLIHRISVVIWKKVEESIKKRRRVKYANLILVVLFSSMKKVLPEDIGSVK